MGLESIKESKVIRGLLRIGIIISTFFLTFESYELFNEIDETQNRKIVETFEDYFEFEPNSIFSTEAVEKYEVYTMTDMEKYDALVYTEYLTRWAGEPDVDILRLELYTFYRQQGMKVCTYVNPQSYDASWDDFVLPLKEGRWFEGDQDEVICINDSSYKIGDLVELEDEEGRTFQATVVGKASYPYLFDNLGMAGSLAMAICKYDDTAAVFLLNPQSVHNRKSDLIDYGTTLIKTDNEVFISKIREYGTCTPIKRILINEKPDFVRPILIMIVSIIAFGLLLAGEFILKCYKGTGWCIGMAGVLAYIGGCVLYVEVEYKMIVAIGVCTIIGLIYILISRLIIERKTKEKLNYDIVVLDEEIME